MIWCWRRGSNSHAGCVSLLGNVMAKLPAEYARMGKADNFDRLSLLLDSDPSGNMGNAQLSCSRRW